MRILSITAQKPHSTGSGTYLTELVNSFARAGHEQAVVCGIYPDDRVEFPKGVACYPVFFTDTAVTGSAAGESLFAPCKAGAAPGSTPVLKRDLPYPIVGMSDIMPYTSTRYRDLTPEMVSAFEAAFTDAAGRAIADLDPDVIICHHLFLLTAMLRKHFPGRRICGISHGTDLRQMANCDALREIVRPEIAKLDRIFALHEEQRTQIMEIFGIPADRAMVIGSGYNDRVFNMDGRMPRVTMEEYMGTKAPVMICYAGKMSRPKGVPELLEALRSLNDDPEVPPFEVNLAGGCQDGTVRTMLDDLPANMRWLDQVPQQRLAQIFRFNDVFVLPSYFEGLPLVLIEAMASGMVPVSTDLPGVQPWISENVPDQNVRFVPMPEMETIDTPTAAGRAKFTEDLRGVLKDLIIEIYRDGSFLPHPDTSGISWDGVAKRIIRFI